MAEVVATIAGVSFTIPAILQGAYTILMGAYDLYGQVDNRKEEVKALLERCTGLIKRLAEEVQLRPGISLKIQNARDTLEATFESIKSLVEILAKKGFLWILLHPDRIDRLIKSAETSISDAFTMFGLGVQIDNSRFLAEMERARRSDRQAFSTRLRAISENDSKIIQALCDANGVQRRLEEVLIAIYKRVETLPGSDVEKTPEGIFIKGAANALMRTSDRRSDQVIASWLVSSLEVEFQPSDLVAQGAFGRIFKGEWNGVIVAIKQMYREDATLMSDADRKSLKNEVRIWSQLQHPNVLSLFGACPEAESPFLLMRYCQLGNILTYLKSSPENANRPSLCYDIAAGLSFLHNKRIIHADLKGVNVLVGDDQHAQLTDFGLSLMIDDVRSRSTATDASRGTLRWMAPECINGSRASEASDVYSLGMTMWEVFSEEVPLSSFVNRIVAYQIDKGVRPTKPDRLQLGFVWDLIERCWSADASKRPRAEEVRHLLKSSTSYTRVEDDMSRHSSSKSNPSRLSVKVDNSPSPSFSDTLHGSSTTQYTDVGTTKKASLSNYMSALSGRTTLQEVALPVNATPWSQTEWADALRFDPPKWQRGSPNVYLDSVTFPVPTRKAYAYRLVKGPDDLGVKPTYPFNDDGSQTVNFLEYNQGYGISDRTPIRLIAIEPDGLEVLIATGDWSRYIFSSPPQWIRGPGDVVSSLILARVPSLQSYAFRVFEEHEDLGSIATARREDGSVQVNFLEYDRPGGISETKSIHVYAVDPDGHEEFIAFQDATKSVVTSKTSLPQREAITILEDSPSSAAILNDSLSKPEGNTRAKEGTRGHFPLWLEKLLGLKPQK